MDILIERCCGLDVHLDTVVASVRTPGKGRRRSQETRTFGTMTTDVLALRDWLVAMGVTLCGMESTGVYWKPIYYVLEDATKCWLLNARHLRNVPGRKTDVGDPEWICPLLADGTGSGGATDYVACSDHSRLTPREENRRLYGVQAGTTLDRRHRLHGATASCWS